MSLEGFSTFRFDWGGAERTVYTRGSGPGVVVISLYPLNQPINIDSYRRIRRYVHSQCRVVGTEVAYELGVKSPMVIFGDCRPPKLQT